MISTSRIVVIAAAASITMASSAASASVFVATWTGTVQFGTDNIGVFGAPGADLAGDTYVAKFTYDTNIGRITVPGRYDAVYGGTYPGGPTPLTATITINGITAANDGGFDSLEETAQTSPTWPAYIISYASDSVPGGGYPYHDIIDLEERGQISESLITSIVPLTHLNIMGGFSVDTNIYGVEGAFGRLYSSGTLQICSLLGTAEVCSLSVPEPATWLVMLTGFGIVGAGLRARRRRAIVA